ncbi:MAG: formate/nitrite transporter family protein, partial [Candidatus Bathyarchaeota archaeon]|nr:formate/nitrite transporter family protein [Candidatus Bathyarchaeota archaeon]
MSKMPKEIAERVCESGSAKTALSPLKTLVLAILAGAYIGFGGHLATVVSQDSRTFIGGGLTSIISGLVFSLGLILVVLGGAELFTGNSLLTIPCLRGTVKTSALLRNWGIVYIGNFIGSLLLVALIFLGGLYLTNNA